MLSMGPETQHVQVQPQELHVLETFNLEPSPTNGLSIQLSGWFLLGSLQGNNFHFEGSERH